MTICYKCHENFVPVDVSGILDGDMVCITCGASETPPRNGHPNITDDTEERPSTQHKGAGALHQTEVILYHWPTRWTGEGENPPRLKYIVTVHWIRIRQDKRNTSLCRIIAIEGLAEIKAKVRFHVETRRISLLVLRQFCQATRLKPEEIRGLTHFGFKSTPDDYREVHYA